MLVIREHLARIAGDAVRDNQDGTFQCVPCDTPLTDETRSRSIWTYPWPAGFGKVLPVRHVYCPSCHPEYRPPNEDGAEGIYSLQLIDVDEKLMPTGMMKDLELATQNMARMDPAAAS